MKNLLCAGAITLSSALFLVSCAPLNSSAIRHNDGVPIYTPPGSWTSGGHYAGFAPSRPSANGYNSSSSAPC